MANRILLAKRLKMAKAQRSAPRSLGVNWHNGRAVKSGHLDISVEGVAWYEQETRKPRAPSNQDLGLTFNGLRLITLINNVFQKVQIAYTSKRDEYYIIWYRYNRGVVHVSGSYPSLGKAKTAFERDPKKVLWKYKRNLAKQTA